MANRAAIVNAAVKRCNLWHSVWVMGFTENMRVARLLATLGQERAAEQQQFADYLLSVGERRDLGPAEHLRLPDNMVVPGERTADLIRDVYGDLRGGDDSLRTPETLISRCILSPKNADVLDLNDQVTDLLPGRVSGMNRDM